MKTENITQENIRNATLEAIYWWNRDEDYYHKYYSKLDKIYSNKSALDFFIQKIFEMFLREYAVRRNISKGEAKLKSFIDELFENNFFENVVKGNIEIIDSVSEKLKENKTSTIRNTRSLLSKIAFLINPNKFYLYDSLTKNSIWDIYKRNLELKRSSLESYCGFVKQTECLREYIANQDLFRESFALLSEFKDTSSYRFFSNSANHIAFEMRIVDKFLWLSNQSTNNKIINNNIYIEFHNL